MNISQHCLKAILWHGCLRLTEAVLAGPAAGGGGGGVPGTGAAGQGEALLAVGAPGAGLALAPVVERAPRAARCKQGTGANGFTGADTWVELLRKNISQCESSKQYPGSVTRYIRVQSQNRCPQS